MCWVQKLFWAEENALEPEVVVAGNSDAVNVLSASESFTLKFYVNFHLD